MRTLVSSLVLFGLAAFAAADDPPAKKGAPPPARKDAPPEKKKDAPPAKEKKDDSADTKEAPPAEGTSLQKGKDVPGPFHPYNVTGPHKQRYHCLVSDHGLDPMVVIFHKNVEFEDPLRNLLKALDAAIDKNPNVRLASFAVFLPDDLPEAVGADDKSDDLRRELEAKVAQAGADLKLKHVVLCLDSKADVEKYGLRDGDLATVVLYDRYKVVEVFRLPGSEFKDDAVEKIMAAVAGRLGAKRK